VPVSEENCGTLGWPLGAGWARYILLYCHYVNVILCVDGLLLLLQAVCVYVFCDKVILMTPR